MKLLILLAVASCAIAAKLDRTYLPPSYAQTSGGNENFLQTPLSGQPQKYQNSDYTQATSNAYGPSNNFAQNDFAQNAGFEQSTNYQNKESFAQNGNAGFDGFNNFEQRPERAQAAFEKNAAILRQDSSNDGETYSYAYETENGIVAEESGVATNGVQAQGGFSYTGDDGQVYSVRYTADENGFVPQGDHLPTPPPIPEEILKALEQNARDEANGIFDDGSYSEQKYADDVNNQYSDENGYNYDNGNGNNFNAGGNFNGNSGNFNGAPANYETDNSFNADITNDDDTVVTNNALIRSNTHANFINNGVQKEYLPPLAQNAQLNQAPNGLVGQNQKAVQKAYLPPFAQNERKQASPARFTARNGFNNQKGVEREYLPPQQFGQRNQNGATSAFNRRNGGFGNQTPNAALRTYVPPSRTQGRTNQPTFGNQGRSQGFGSRNSVNREYLPPNQNQRTSQRNGFSRRPSFSDRDGYQY